MAKPLKTYAIITINEFSNNCAGSASFSLAGCLLNAIDSSNARAIDSLVFCAGRALSTRFHKHCAYNRRAYRCSRWHFSFSFCIDRQCERKQSICRRVCARVCECIYARTIQVKMIITSMQNWRLSEIDDRRRCLVVDRYECSERRSSVSELCARTRLPLTPRSYAIKFINERT